MDTVKQESREQLIKWLAEGIRNGSLKTQPVYDSEGRITSINIVLDGVDDPRRSMPDRYRRARPL